MKDSVKLFKRGAPDRGSKWFAHLPIPQNNKIHLKFQCPVRGGWGGGLVEPTFNF